jgi:hypothetical protein
VQSMTAPLQEAFAHIHQGDLARGIAIIQRTRLRVGGDKRTDGRRGPNAPEAGCAVQRTKVVGVEAAGSWGRLSCDEVRDRFQVEPAPSLRRGGQPLSDLGLSQVLPTQRSVGFRTSRSPEAMLDPPNLAFTASSERLKSPTGGFLDFTKGGGG